MKNILLTIILVLTFKVFDLKAQDQKLINLMHIKFKAYSVEELKPEDKLMIQIEKAIEKMFSSAYGDSICQLNHNNEIIISHNLGISITSSQKNLRDYCENKIKNISRKIISSATQ